MRQIYPGSAELGNDGLARCYAYPDPPAGGAVPAGHSTPVGAAVPAPWLRANMVSSLDGAASVRGRSGGLSGKADRQVLALLRALADVVLVGAGTVRTEGYRPVRPQSEGRRWSWLRQGRPPSPPIAVVTRLLSLDLESPLLAGAPGHARTIIITTAAAPASRRAAAAAVAEVIVAGEETVSMEAAVGALAGLGYRRILTEGGPHLLGELVTTGLLDEVCLTISPLLAGPGPGRIVQAVEPAGPPAAPAAVPRPLTLGHVLTDDGYLFCRYLKPGPSVG